MKKKTLTSLYSLTLIGGGLSIAALGFAFGDIESLSTLSGSEDFVFTIKFIGSGLVASGLVGLGWTLTLSDNPILSGYAGLSRNGLVVFLTPLLFAGPFWLLIAWLVWFVPAFRADPSPLDR